MLVRSLTALLLLASASVLPTRPGAPVATVDRLDDTVIAGTARDPDAPSAPMTMHIYVDGQLYDSVVASPRFEYRHAPFGPGRHEVEAYALGINAAGAFDGPNVRAAGPTIVEGSCDPFAADPPVLSWCSDMPLYWQNRARDTKALFNRYVWIGVNNSYGGLIAQLYGEDRSVNLPQ